MQFLRATKLSQNDKRVHFARNAARFLVEHRIQAVEIAHFFGNDAVLIRDALINYPNMGYGAKRPTCSSATWLS